MRRREFITLLGGAAAAVWPCAVHGDQVYRVGFLWDGPDVFPDEIEAFRQGLRELGYVEGRNLAFEYRWGEGKPDRIRALAQELVRLKVDIIVAPSSIYTEAAKQATSTIPIVFMSHADPLGTGHVANLTYPGGNATGFSLMMPETTVKGLELFKEAVPALSRIAVIFDPATPSHGPSLKAAEAAKLGLRIQPVPVRSATEYESAFSSIVRERADGVLVLAPLFIAGAKQVFVKSASTQVKSSRARNLPTCRSCSRANSSSSSTCKRPGHLALKCPRRCSRAPTR